MKCSESSHLFHLEKLYVKTASKTINLFLLDQWKISHKQNVLFCFVLLFWNVRLLLLFFLNKEFLKMRLPEISEYVLFIKFQVMVTVSPRKPYLKV